MACLMCLCANVSLMDRRGLITPYFLKRQKASGHRFQHTCHTGSPTHSTQTCHWRPSPFPLLDSRQLWPSVTEKCNKLLCYRFWGQMSNIPIYLPEWSRAQALTQGWVFSVQGVDVMSARESERERKKTGFLFWMPSRSVHSTRQLSVGLMSPAGEDVLGVSRAADFSGAREHSPHELGVIWRGRDLECYNRAGEMTVPRILCWWISRKSFQEVGGVCNSEQRSGCALVRKYNTLLEVQKLRADVQINGKSLRVLKCFLHRMCLPAQGLAND